MSTTIANASCASHRPAWPRRAVWLAVVAGGLGAALWLGWRQTRVEPLPDLTQRARPVPGSEEWQEGVVPFSAWLPGERRLLIEEGVGGRWQARAVEARTGREVPAPPIPGGLIGQVQRHPLGNDMLCPDSVSPDGRWIACSWMQGVGKRGSSFDAVAIGGSRRLSWPTGFPPDEDSSSKVAWTPDSRRFVAVEGALSDPRVRVCDVGTGKSCTLRIRPPLLAYTSEPVFVGVTAGMELLWCEVPPTDSSQPILLYTAPLRDGAPTRRTGWLRRPPGELAAPPVLSPDGRLLLWALDVASYPSPVRPAWLQQLLVSARLRRTPRRIRLLGVTRVNGNRLHTLGYMAPDADPADPGLEWLPDSRRISFLCDDKTWVMDTPRL